MKPEPPSTVSPFARGRIGQLTRMVDTEYDVVVVGGGAAGLAAALVLSQARRDVLVVDSGRVRNEPAAHAHGFLSRDGSSPAELLGRGRAEVRECGGTVLDGTVTTHCPYCHGHDVRDQPGGVLGQAPEVVHFAQMVGLGCGVDDDGWVTTGETGVPGVWAAGNVAAPRAQVITAAGEGSAAAIAINADLVDEDVQNAVGRHSTAAGLEPATAGSRPRGPTR